jgi:acetyl-CoA carboxylase biotin carboxyl carrier protein
MFKLNEIRELIRLLDETSIAELNVESAGTKLTIKKSEVAGLQAVSSPAIQQPAVATMTPVPAVPAPAPVQYEAPEVKKEGTPEKAPVKKGDVEDSSLVKIVSPMVGTFYRAPAPDAPPYVQVGDKVTERTVVCIVEAMKLMNEIEAEVRGEIVDILVENGQLVEYGQPMFLVKPE